MSTDTSWEALQEKFGVHGLAVMQAVSWGHPVDNDRYITMLEDKLKELQKQQRQTENSIDAVRRGSLE